MECLLTLSRQGARILLGLEPDATVSATARPPAPSTGDVLTLDLGGGVKMELVLIPAGEFLMGSPVDEAGREDNEGPQHKVRLTRAFYLGGIVSIVCRLLLGACEVTNGQYRKFRKDHDSDSGKRADLVKRGGLSLNHDDQPVLAASWDDAKAFCDWLSKKEGVDYRLPMEAEFEYASRAGSTERYWWGESEKDAGKYANVYDKTSSAELKFPWTAFETDDGYAVTAPVGKYLPNAFGLHDMIGNVWEWCGDWYDEKYYARSPKDDPAGPAVGGLRVLRGGSWHGGPWCVRCAHRGRGVPTVRVDFLGFRVAVPAPR